ncbi:MAG: N-acetyltransferase [Eubacteriales bacterium]|nr:N-acetyltransferase [Eubacteriales bacterium]
MIEIREKTTKKELKEFIAFQNELFKNDPKYVPTLLEDELGTLDKTKNPAFDFCESRYFMAYRDGKAVGRIAAIHNKAYNEIWGKKCMRFTRFDTIEDVEVAQALFGAVEDWARELGLEEISGPHGFCDLDKEGMQVEGFDEMGQFITFYNYPYYPRFMEELGFTKEVDWVEMQIKTNRVNERMRRIAGIAKRRFKLHAKKYKHKRDVKPDIKKIFELLNEAYKPLFGVVPLSEKQINLYVSQYYPLLDHNLISTVFNERDEMVGFGLCMPSLNESVIKAKGKLFPFGFVPFFREMKKTKVLDLYLIAVRPDYQGKGVNAIIFDELQEYIVNRFELALTGPELELNEKVQAQWDGYETRLYKRRRCYIKRIGAA